MITEETVRVIEVLEKTEDLYRIQTSGGCGRAILYRRFHPDIKEGDLLIVNTTATELGLGTGGWDIVRAVVKEENRYYTKTDQNGHIMKARYLSDQHSVLSVEAPESNSHRLFKGKLDLKGRRIMICELHSMVPIIWFLLQHRKEGTPLTVIFSDEASLPLLMSNHLAFLKEQDSFLSITVGQSFGGEIEAINLVTALQYIKEKDIQGMVLITLGPGVVGTNTYYGFSGIAQASWANSIVALGGEAVWVPRLSQADARIRHQGISHHTVTPLTELTTQQSTLPIPAGSYSNQWLERDVQQLTRYTHVKIRKVSEQKLLPQLAVIQEMSPFPLSTMGRTIDKDPLFFLGVAAAVDWYFADAHQSSNV